MINLNQSEVQEMHPSSWKEQHIDSDKVLHVSSPKTKNECVVILSEEI